MLPNSTYPPSILLPTILGVALDSLILLSFSSLRIRGQHRIVTLLQAGSGTSLLALTLMMPLSDGQVALFAVARTILSIIFFLILFIYMGRDYLKNRAPLMGFGQILGASRTFMWAEMASSVYVKADLTIISIVIGPLGTSVYGPAITVLQAAFIILRALFYYFVPILSKTYSKNIKDYVYKSIVHFLIQITTGAGISIFLFLLAEPIINLIFTSTYADSAVILRLLSPIPFIRSINFALGAVLTSSHRQGRRTRVQISAALFNIVGNLLIIGPLGINGVAIIYVFSELFLALGYILLVRDLRKQLSLAK
jgi:O-antigen/teichoic acid export membrane protein